MENVLTLIRDSKIEEAETELSRRESEGAVGPDWHCARGLLLEAKGEIEGAAEAFEAAREIDGANANATFHLARTLDVHGADDRAMELYESLALRTPAHVNALLNLSVIYEDRGHYEDALQCIERVLVEHPNHARAELFRKDVESSMNMHYDETQEQSIEQQDALFDTPVSDFELSVRSRNCLKRMNINTLGDLLQITEAELLSYKNFGETSLEEIKAMLSQKGLRIGQLKEEAQRTTRPSTPAPAAPAVPGSSPDLLNRFLSEIEFSGRSRKCLQRLGLVTVGDLTVKSEAELLAAKNFGQTSLNEIKQKLVEFGLSLRK